MKSLKVLSSLIAILFVAAPANAGTISFSTASNAGWSYNFDGNYYGAKTQAVGSTFLSFSEGGATNVPGFEGIWYLYGSAFSLPGDATNITGYFDAVTDDRAVVGFARLDQPQFIYANAVGINPNGGPGLMNAPDGTPVGIAYFLPQGSGFAFNGFAAGAVYAPMIWVNNTNTFDLYAISRPLVAWGDISVLAINGTINYSRAADVPEPASMALLGLGALSGFALRRIRARA